MQKASLLETYEPFLGRVTVEEFIAGGNVEHYFAEHWQQGDGRHSMRRNAKQTS